MFGTEMTAIADHTVWSGPLSLFKSESCPSLLQVNLLVFKVCLPLYDYRGNPDGMEDGNNPRQECPKFPQFLPVVL